MSSTVEPSRNGQSYFDRITDRVRNNDPSLTELRMMGCGRYGFNFKTLVNALADNSSVISVNLSSNGLCDEDAIALALALGRNAFVTELNLSHNDISEEGSRALAAALKQNSSLMKLNLKFNRISNDGSKALAVALLWNKSLAVLDLGNNCIGEEGTRRLAEALRENESLVVLNLPNNKIGDDAAKVLSAALRRNVSLAAIDLSHNNIGNDGAKAIAQALGPPSLTELYVWCREHLQGNEGKIYIGKKGKVALDELQPNSTLSSLFLYSREIGKDGAVAFLQALRGNKVITKFWFNYDNSWAAIKKEIVELINSNQDRECITKK